MKNNFNDLVETFAILRGPNGCPWDKKQTHETLIKNMREESEELIRAIENKDDENMKEELGDVLLQVLLHAQIAKEEGKFTIDDVIQGLYDKLHYRHPHVFGDVKAKSPEEALAVWKEMKRKSREEKEKKVTETAEQEDSEAELIKKIIIEYKDVIDGLKDK